MTRTSETLVSLVSLALTVAASAQPAFHRLGFLTVDGFGPSLAFGVSADGNVAVGMSNSPLGFQAFRWSAGDGMVGLGAFQTSGFPFSQAFGVSGDSSVIVGSSMRDDSLNEDGSPFRWTAATGLVYPGNLDG